MKLSEAIKIWPGQEFLAIVGAKGLSSGPGIDRHVVIQRQFAVLKPPRGKVTVVLQRNTIRNFIF